MDIVDLKITEAKRQTVYLTIVVVAAVALAVPEVGISRGVIQKRHAIHAIIVRGSRNGPVARILEQLHLEKFREREAVEIFPVLACCYCATTTTTTTMLVAISSSGSGSGSDLPDVIVEAAIVVVVVLVAVVTATVVVALMRRSAETHSAASTGQRSDTISLSSFLSSFSGAFGVTTSNHHAIIAQNLRRELQAQQGQQPKEKEAT